MLLSKIVIFSKKLIIDLKKIVNQKTIKRILVINGGKSYEKSNARQLINEITKNIQTYFFTKQSYYPEINELKKIISYKNWLTPNLIIAVGGGSVIDYGKLTNFFSSTNFIEKKIKEEKYEKGKSSKLLVFPTTAGSGAEVTSNAVIYINKVKFSVESNLLIPDYFRLIPELIITAPKLLKSSSGFDAISQSIESMISKKSNNQSLLYASKALKILNENYINFLKNPKKNNAYNMSLGAHYAGKAISISKTTAPHALSYPFTSHFSIPHGHAVSLTFNQILTYNYKNVENSNCNFNLLNRYKKIFRILGVSNIDEFNIYINKLKKNAGLENNFLKLNINLKKDLNKILVGVNNKRLDNNPIKLSREILKDIITN